MVTATLRMKDAVSVWCFLKIESYLGQRWSLGICAQVELGDVNEGTSWFSQHGSLGWA